MAPKGKSFVCGCQHIIYLSLAQFGNAGMLCVNVMPLPVAVPRKMSAKIAEGLAK